MIRAARWPVLGWRRPGLAALAGVAFWAWLQGASPAMAQFGGPAAAPALAPAFEASDMARAARLSAEGFDSQAVSVLRPTLARVRETAGPDGVRAALIEVQIARRLSGPEALAEKESLLGHAAPILARTLGPRDPHALEAAAALADAVLIDPAYESQSANTVWLARAAPLGPPPSRLSLAALGKLKAKAAASGNAADKIAAARALVDIDMAWLGSTHPAVVAAKGDLALLLDSGSPEQIATTRDEVRGLVDAGAGIDEVILRLDYYVYLLVAAGREDEAVAELRRDLPPVGDWDSVRAALQADRTGLWASASNDTVQDKLVHSLMDRSVAELALEFPDKATDADRARSREAASRWQDATAIRRKILEDAVRDKRPNVDIALAQVDLAGDLAQTAINNDDSATVAALLEPALATLARARGPRDPDTLRASEMLASAYNGTLDGAELGSLVRDQPPEVRLPTLQEAVRIRRLQRAAIDAEEKGGDLERAIALWRQRLALLGSTVGPGHPEATRDLAYIGQLKFRLGEDGMAECREGLARASRSTASTKVAVYILVSCADQIVKARGQGEARAWLRDFAAETQEPTALELVWRGMREQAAQPEHAPAVRQLVVNLSGEGLRGAGRWLPGDEAEDSALLAIAGPAPRALVGPTAKTTPATAKDAADLERRAESAAILDPDGAEALYQQAYDLWARLERPTQIDRVLALAALTTFKEHLHGRDANAESDVVATIGRVGPEDRNTVDRLLAAAEAGGFDGKAERRAEGLRAIEIARKLEGPNAVGLALIEVRAAKALALAQGHAEIEQMGIEALSHAAPVTKATAIRLRQAADAWAKDSTGAYGDEIAAARARSGAILAALTARPPPVFKAAGRRASGPRSTARAAYERGLAILNAPDHADRWRQAVDQLNIIVRTVGPSDPLAAQLTAALVRPGSALDPDLADRLRLGPPAFRIPTAKEQELITAVGSKAQQAQSPDEYRTLYGPVLAVLASTWGPRHAAYGKALQTEAAGISQLFGEVGPELDRAIDIFTERLGPEHSWTLSARGTRWNIVWRSGLKHHALPSQAPLAEGDARALLAYHKALGDHDGTTTLEGNIAILLDYEGKPAEAVSYYRSALQAYLAQSPSGRIDETTYGVSYAADLEEAYERAGQFKEAEAERRADLADIVRVYGDTSERAAKARLGIANDLWLQHRNLEAADLWREVLMIQTQYYGPNSVKTRAVAQQLAEVEAGRPAPKPALRELGTDPPVDLADPRGPGFPRAPDYGADQEKLDDLRQSVEAGEASRDWTSALNAIAGSIKLADAHDDRSESYYARLDDEAATLEHLDRNEDAEAVRLRILAGTGAAFGPASRETGKALMALAANLDRQTRWAEAEGLIQRANAILEDPRDGLLALAAAIEQQGRPADAEQLRRLLVRHNGGDTEYSALAANLQAQGKLEEAIAVLTGHWHISYALAGGLADTPPDVARRVAAILLEKGEPAAAEPAARRALEASETTLGDDGPDTARARLLLGRALRGSGFPFEAEQQFKAACPVLGRLGREAGIGDLAEERADTAASECARETALTLWDLRAKRGYSAPAAFLQAQIAVTSRVGLSLSRVGARRAAGAIKAAAPAEEYEALLSQRRALDASYIGTVRNADGADTGRGALEQSRAALDLRLEAVTAVLKQKFQPYWDLRSPQPIAIDALEARSGADAMLLRPNEALVVWMTDSSRDNGLVFAVSKAGGDWARIGLTGKDIADKIVRLRARIDPPGHAQPAFDRRMAHELYVALLGDPKIQQVIGGAGIDTLLVVPSGALTNLPPSLLVEGDPVGSDTDPQALRDTSWLIRHWAIAVLPTVSALKTLREILPQARARAGAKRVDLPLLALADPDFRGDGVIPMPRPAGRTVRSAPANAEGPADLERLYGKLEPLYHTFAEGQALRTLLNAPEKDLLLGPDASKTRLLDRQLNGTLARTRVVAFATHGFLTGDFGLTEPALALAHPVGKVVSPDDGLLTASEAATLKLNADWVVLSACNTASPDHPGGDGLSGLARAFIYAGANALLVSHWRVQDDAAQHIVTETFAVRQANPKLSKAMALKASMLSLLDDKSQDNAPDDPQHTQSFANPWEWAPFVVVGEAN
jgi:CHAT domain-containing protein